jgi:hypothetical protein
MSGKRSISVFSAVILLTVVSAGYMLVTARPTAAVSAPIGRTASAVNDEIHWTITGPNSVTLDWRGPSNALRYGVTTAYGATATAVTPSHLPYSSAGPFWEARLTNLQPNTTYHYSIGGEADHTFKTALPKGSSASFTVDVIGDVGDTTTYDNVGPVQAMIAADQPSMVLLAGDLTYGNAHGQAVVDQHFNDVQVWSLGSTAYMPAWGNHEWDSSTDNLNNYKGRFDFPNQQTSPGSPAISCCGEDWYYFDYGNTRFIAYPEPYSGAWADWNTKAKVLMDAAQADPAITFIVTFGHRPAYSSGHHPGETSLKNYLDNLGATHSKYVLNLNGHSHNYERTFPQSNVVHITAGMGGSSLEQDGTCLWLTCTQPPWSAQRYMRHGVVKLTFNANYIQGDFICGPAGGGTNDITCTQGQVIDTFTIGGNPGPTNTPTATGTSTSTRTPTPTNTSTKTPTATGSSTSTRTPTPTNTSTKTRTPTPTNTSTKTRTPTPTNTSTKTPTATGTSTPTRTPTPTNTSTKTPTRTATPTQTPTTKTLILNSSAVYDGWILESSETSTIGGTMNSIATTFRLGDDAARRQYRGLLSFDTGASLPDNAVITKVTLRVKMQSIAGIGNPVVIFRGFMVDIKRGSFGTPALQTADFQTAANKTYGPLVPALSIGWYSIDLTSGKAYINKLDTLSGLTQIRLRFQLDDNNNSIANYLNLYSGNAGAASRPQLVIQYYVP